MPKVFCEAFGPRCGKLGNVLSFRRASPWSHLPGKLGLVLLFAREASKGGLDATRVLLGEELAVARHLGGAARFFCKV